MYRLSCVTVIYVSRKKENTHPEHSKTKWRWKGVGVWEQEPTKNYVKLALAPQMGQEIMSNAVRELHFWNCTGTLLDLRLNCAYILVLVLLM